MRILIVAAAFATVVGPAMAQGTPVTVKLRMDSVRVRREQLTTEQVRKLAAEVNGLIAQNMRYNDLWLKELHSPAPDAKRIEVLQDEMERNGWVLLPKQSEFAMVCAMLRRQDDGAPGTLGLQLDDSVHWVFDQQLGTLTVVVSAPRKIAAVAMGSPAEMSGVQAGDVLISINGRPFIDSVRFDELLKPGSSVIARVQRGRREFDSKPMTVVQRVSDLPVECNNAKQFDISTPFFKPGASGIIAVMPLKPGERTSLPGMPPGGTNIQMFISTTSKVLYGGAVMQPLDDEWRQFSGLQGEGLIITDLPEGSPAEAAGLRRFDVIKLINNEPVTTTAAFQKIARVEQKLTFTVFSKKAGVHTVTMVR